jgi:small conductance mechanosensitive channel
MLEGLTWEDMQMSAVAVAAILLLMFGGLWASKRAIRRLAERMEEKDQEQIQEIERWANELTRFIRRAIWIVASIAAVFIVLHGVGIEGMPRMGLDQVVGWFVGSGLRILLVLGGAYALARAARFLVARLPTFMASREGTAVEKAEEEKRMTTITGLLSMLLTTVIMAIAVLIVLREIGLDITPILTGAGIAGLAVGFGAQNLVRDIITGFFMILENQVRVGDVAVINGKGGVVQEMRLRTVVLRSLDGRPRISPTLSLTSAWRTRKTPITWLRS